MLYQDLQEIFWVLYGPYILGLLLPVFVSSGLFLAMLMAVSTFWRPLETVKVRLERDQDY